MPDNFQAAIREGKAEDHAFVFATMLRNIRHSSPLVERIPERLFYRDHHDLIERLLQRGRLTVATPTDSPDLIVGYLLTDDAKVAGRAIVHFIYTKFSGRGMGVARALLAEAADHVGRLGVDRNVVAFTHSTEDGDRLARRFPHAYLNPYLAA